VQTGKLTSTKKRSEMAKKSNEVKKKIFLTVNKKKLGT